MYRKIAASEKYFYNDENLDAPMSIKIALSKNGNDGVHSYPAFERDFPLRPGGNFEDTNGVAAGELSLWCNEDDLEGSLYIITEPDGYQWSGVLPYGDGSTLSLPEWRALATTPGNLVDGETLRSIIDEQIAAAGGGGGGGTPGGATTQIQFNNAGAFAGSSNFTWDNSNNTYAVTGESVLTAINATAKPLTVQLAASQTGDAVRILASGSSTPIAKIDASGKFFNKGMRASYSSGVYYDVSVNSANDILFDSPSGQSFGFDYYARALIKTSMLFQNGATTKWTIGRDVSGSLTASDSLEITGTNGYGFAFGLTGSLSNVLIGTPVETGAGNRELIVGNDKNFRGVNAAGNNTIPLIKLNASNQVAIASGGADTVIGGTLYLTDGTIKQVTFGANDSGGAGFKVLRIAN